ncbi:MAG: hypothetical protein QOF37_3057 [Thermoleophilaceae bacterium]|jgi:hypothetical protein|nr:hypothetical protein [Thermoleophilaceae bacterium]
MFHARLICSDDDCAEAFDAWGPLEELEALACDCGCALQILALSEAGEEAQLELARGELGGRDLNPDYQDQNLASYRLDDPPGLALAA